MKKVYQKPVLLKEQFRMEEMIAACAVINSNPTQSQECNYQAPGLMYPLFSTDWQACGFFAEDLEKQGLTTLCKAPGASNLWSS